MATNDYASQIDGWPPLPKGWVNQIITCICQLSEGILEASAKRIERHQRVQLELRVEWFDTRMKEFKVETFTYEPDHQPMLGQ